MKLPLQIILPFGSLILAGGLAIGIGLINLEFRDAFNANGPIAFAAGLTALVMLVAALLSKNAPDPEDGGHH